MVKRPTHGFGLAVLGIAALVGLTRLGGPRIVHAFNPQPEPPGYAAVSMWDDTLLSVHLVNVKSADARGGIAPCVAEVEFFNGIGGSLGVHSGLIVGPGEIVSADLRFPAGAAGRMTVRPVIRFMREVNACDGILSSAEVVDDTGATAVFVDPLTLRGFNPQPEPPGVQ